MTVLVCPGCDGSGVERTVTGGELCPDCGGVPTREQRLTADWELAREYDEQRGQRPYDATHGRRFNALLRMERELTRAGVSLVEPPFVPKRLRQEAFERLVARRLSGRRVSSSVVEALEATARHFELDVPERLRAAEGYESGGSRPARARRSRRAAFDRRWAS